MVEAYENSLDRLREAAGPNAEESAAIEALAATADRQEKLIERVQTRQASCVVLQLAAHGIEAADEHWHSR